MNRFIEYPDRVDLFRRLSDSVEAQLCQALKARGRATLAVPGGSTPAPFFELLRDADMDWEHVSVMLTDERFVPETSERSNTRLLKNTLLQHKAQAAQLVALYRAGATPEDVLETLQADVARALPLDVCVLGMGVDMHTASLFPNADLLDRALAQDAPVLLPMRAPGADEPRLTLTAPVLRAARSVHILITGVEKKAAYETALRGTSRMDAPVRVVLGRATTHYAQ